MSNISLFVGVSMLMTLSKSIHLCSPLKHNNRDEIISQFVDSKLFNNCFNKLIANNSLVQTP